MTLFASEATVAAPPQVPSSTAAAPSVPTLVAAPVEWKFIAGAVAAGGPLTGTGAFSAAAVALAVRAPLTGGGGFSAASVEIGITAAPLAGSGAFSAASVEIDITTAPLTGAGGFSAVAVIDGDPIPADLTGSGAFGAVAAQAVTAAYTGTGGFTAAATQATPAALTGTGGFTGTAAQATSGPLTGTGGFSATAILVVSRTGNLTGSGAFTATASVVPILSAPLAGSGVFSATANIVTPLSAALTGSGVFSATASVVTEIPSAPARLDITGGTSTASNVTAGGAGSLAVTYPTATVSGDFLLMFITTYRDSTTAYTHTTPTGWTLAYNQITASDPNVHSIYWRFRSTETSVTVNFSASNLKSEAVIMGFLGDTVDATTPIDQITGAYTAASGTGYTAASVTTSAANRALVYFASGIRGGSSTAYTHTWTSTATERVDTSFAMSTPTNRWGLTAATDTQTTAGATGTRTLTASVAVFNRFIATVAVAPRAVRQVASDSFTRSTLGGAWTLGGGGNLYINNNEITGAGVPPEPMSYAHWWAAMPSQTQIVRAKVRWAGRDPAHSATAVVVRAQPSSMPANGTSGAQFWFVRDLMGILYETTADPDGFIAATGTADYVSTTKFPEGADVELRADGIVYTAFVNGVQRLQGTIATSAVPLTAGYVGVMAQDDSNFPDDPPANLDDWRALTPT